MITQTFTQSITKTFSSFTQFTKTSTTTNGKAADDKGANTIAQDNPPPKPIDNVDKIEISSGNGKQPALSQAALNYLEELKSKFGNVDFIIADFSSDKEAQQLLKQGKGEFNAVITPSLLESMAANKDVAAKYENVIESSIGNLVDAKKQVAEKVEAGELKEISKEIQNFGVSINSDGEVSYYALFKSAMPQSDYISEYNKMVKAGSVEELLEILAKMDEELANKNKNVDNVDKEKDDKDKDKDKEKKIDISA